MVLWKLKNPFFYFKNNILKKFEFLIFLFKINFLIFSHINIKNNFLKLKNIILIYF